MPLDHLVLAAPDLAVGIEAFENLTGIAPKFGGVHVGRGTQNALTPFRGGQYLEILAPDPAQDLANTQGQLLAALAKPALFTYCWAARDLESIAERASAYGINRRGPEDFERRKPDGSLMRWRLLFLEGHVFGPLVPFFIDWQDTPHPSQDGPAQLALQTFACESEMPDQLSALLTAVGVDVDVRLGAASKVVATLETPNGLVTI